MAIERVKNVTLMTDSHITGHPSPITLEKEITPSSILFGVKAEGVRGGDTIRGNKNDTHEKRQRRAYVRADYVKPRIPRVIRQSGNKYDISMAARGFYKCPKIGHYCNHGSYKDILNCQGRGGCKYDRHINTNN